MKNKLKLKAYQWEGVKFLLSHWEAILADDMGLGKTATMLMAIKELLKNKKQVLIVTPASLQWNWVREVQLWIGGYEYLFPKSSYKGIHLDTYENLKRWVVKSKGQKSMLELSNIDAVIFDEAHYLKNPKSQRHFWAKEISKACTFVYCLTGTPMSAGVKDLASLLEIIGQLDEFGGYKTFYRKYCDPIYTKYGKEVNGASNQSELKERLKPYLLRRTKDDVGLKLPPKTIKNICVGDMKQEYASTFAEMEDYNRMVNKEKFPLAVEFINNLLEHGKRPVVFVHHKTLLDKLSDKYKGKCVSIYGGQNKDIRQQSIDDFQSGKVPIIICSLMASAVGLTLTSSDTAVFLEYLWTPDISKQAEDRIHRLSQTKPCTIYNLYMNGSIEQQKILTIYSKVLGMEGIL